MAKNDDKQATRPDYGRSMFIFINVLVWVIILCFPFLLATRDGALVRLDRYVIYSWIPLMFMLAFYFNYYFLVDKLIFEKRRWVLFLLCNFVMIVLVASLSNILQEFYLTRIVDAAEPQERFTMLTWIIRDGLVLMLVVGLSVALKMVMAWRQHEQERARLEAEKRDAELANLRSQLNPHFLFNTLNNIYGLTLSDGEKAREAIISLSAIMRYILYTNDALVPLDKELEFIRNYVGLMRLRTGAGMEIAVDMPSDTRGAAIAPLMFMTLVENGFKHGVSPDSPSFLRIAISIESTSRGRQAVVCTVENSDFPKTDLDRSGSGIGLDNLRRRLALLYPGEHELSLDRHDGIHTAKLDITL
ncbi:MAG: sensor histidine kinase [Alistipes sp.]|jgi:sensor histidine kinase YesM|nr:sensor histidine kinase [Alistipes sp.]